MKVTFPHMGNTYIAVKALFDDLGVETVLPPPNSKRTLELGTKYSPELICLPLKINLGNYLESIEKGADTIVVTGSSGPCRYGYYAEVNKEILKDLGKSVEFISLEAPEGDIREFYRRVSKAAQTKNIFKIGKALKRAIDVLQKLNEIEEMLLRLRPYEKNDGIMDQIFNSMIYKLESSQGSFEMIKHLKNALEDMKAVTLEPKEDILKVGIVGEIYTIIEDFTNLDIGKKLNDMGVEVHKSHTAGGWILEHLLYRSRGRTREKDIRQAASPYMNTAIGGHAQETIGYTILYQERGYDGVIQIQPFGCMPEIVAMSVLPTIQEEKNLPILTLIIDEMTGEAGYLTRLEAYVDLLRNRKELKKDEKVLSWR